MQSRYYNPEWGRFINADSLGGKVGELLSHNVFTYCKNNPVNFSDPNGNLPEWFNNIVNTVVKTVNSIVNTVVTYVKKNGANILNSIDNAISSPAASAVISKPDGLIGSAIGNKLTESKHIPIDGPYGMNELIKNPGPISKASSSLIKVSGVLSLCTLGIGAANNFVNYEHPWARTGVDVGCYSLGIAMGIGLVLLAPETATGAFFIITGSFAFSAGTAYLDNNIKNNDYLSRRRD